MKYLLDTHVFIWLDSVPRKLSTQVAAICSDASNQLSVSLASIWEMQIKLQLGKMSLPATIDEIVERQQKENRVELLSINVEHILKLSELPAYHNDPFDRMIIAQALWEDAVILSADSHIAKYPIAVVW